MANAMMKDEIQENAISLDVKDALSAAIERAFSAGSPKKTVLDYISKEEWQTMNTSDENCIVFDPS